MMNLKRCEMNSIQNHLCPERHDCKTEIFLNANVNFAKQKLINDLHENQLHKSVLIRNRSVM